MSHHTFNSVLGKFLYKSSHRMADAIPPGEVGRSQSKITSYVANGPRHRRRSPSVEMLGNDAGKPKVKVQAKLDISRQKPVMRVRRKARSDDSSVIQLDDSDGGNSVIRVKK